ncbi:MAG: hypothetical protein ABI970_04860 [Chloroflexota bacterium]
MMTNDLYYMNTTLGDAMSAAKRGVTVRRIEASMSAYISPIERWADKNYAPKELVYLYHQNTDSSDIVASLRGFQPQDVHVDISHGNVIILLSDDPAYPSRPEYYCEVPLAPDVSQKDAYLEVGAHFLTIRLHRKCSVLKPLTSLLYGFKNGFALFFGCRLNFGRLDD